MQKFLCKIGIHSYRVVEMTDCFTTNYTDANWTIKHIVWYQQCKCCGKRRVKDTYKKDTPSVTRHSGIEYAKVAWVEHGKMYLGSGKETVKKSNVKSFPVIDGGKE